METATRGKDGRRDEDGHEERDAHTHISGRGRVRDVEKHQHTFKADIQKTGRKQFVEDAGGTQSKNMQKTTHMESKENK